MRTKYSYPILLLLLSIILLFLLEYIISLFLLEYNLSILFIIINFLIISFMIKNIIYDIFKYSIKEEKIEYETIIDDGNDSPYCKICSACGEEGCCSPLNCSQHKDGKYCELYLRDLKFAYQSNKEILKYVEENYPEKSDINLKINEILDKNIDKFY
jgi:hypothetical protein